MSTTKVKLLVLNHFVPIAVLTAYAKLSVIDTSCRSRLATLNEKLTQLERRVEYIEARVKLQENLHTPKLTN